MDWKGRALRAEAALKALMCEDDYYSEEEVVTPSFSIRLPQSTTWITPDLISIPLRGGSLEDLLKGCTFKFFDSDYTVLLSGEITTEMVPEDAQIIFSTVTEYFPKASGTTYKFRISNAKGHSIVEVRHPGYLQGFEAFKEINTAESLWYKFKFIHSFT